MLTKIGRKITKSINCCDTEHENIEQIKVVRMCTQYVHNLYLCLLIIKDILIFSLNLLNFYWFLIIVLLPNLLSLGIFALGNEQILMIPLLPFVILRPRNLFLSQEVKPLTSNKLRHNPNFSILWAMCTLKTSIALGLMDQLCFHTDQAISDFTHYFVLVFLILSQKSFTLPMFAFGLFFQLTQILLPYLITVEFHFLKVDIYFYANICAQICMLYTQFYKSVSVCICL